MRAPGRSPPRRTRVTPTEDPRLAGFTNTHAPERGTHEAAAAGRRRPTRTGRITMAARSAGMRLQQPLHHVLVHAHRRAQHARADVRHARRAPATPARCRPRPSARAARGTPRRSERCCRRCRASDGVAGRPRVRRQRHVGRGLVELRRAADRARRRASKPPAGAASGRSCRCLIRIGSGRSRSSISTTKRAEERDLVLGGSTSRRARPRAAWMPA